MKPKITPIRREYSSSTNPNSSAKSQQLRNRYMRTLGITNSSTENTVASRFQKPDQHSKVIPVRTLKEPLKGDDNIYQRRHHRVTSFTGYSPKSVMTPIKEGKIKRQVSFDNSVSVVPIPKRDAYSYRIKKRIWNSATVIHENASRNAMEFSAENWDWRQVIEEKHFFICVDTGELVHPAHANLFMEVQTSACGPSKHKDSFLDMSRANALEWQMRERQVYS